MTEEGELYGWGSGNSNCHGSDEHTPRRVAALTGERVFLVDARHTASCAVTEKGELFTWSADGDEYNLGHGVSTPQVTPKRVEALVGTKVSAVAIGGYHTLVADGDGVVWAFGSRVGTGTDASISEQAHCVDTPTPIPTLRVRSHKSP